MTMEERTEALAKRLYKIAAWQAYEVPWESAPEEERNGWRAEADGLVQDAFPELFNGTAWLAPTEATGPMLRTVGETDEQGWAMDYYGRMRDAHLAATSPSSTPETS